MLQLRRTCTRETHARTMRPRPCGGVWYKRENPVYSFHYAMEFHLVLLLVVLYLSLYTVEADTKSHHSVLYTTTTFTDQRYAYKDEFGQLASYTNSSVTYVSGKLYEPPSNLFNCSLPNGTVTGLPEEPFIVFLQLDECHYEHARIAENIGALGIVFFSEATSTDLTLYHYPLKILVGLVTLSQEELRSLHGILDFSDTTLAVQVNKYSTIPTNSSTFYFVVFAFTVLVFLSLTWFCITYVRRCYDRCTTKRRRSLAQRRAIQTIRKLPVKKYKKVDNNDTDSISSLDQPSCAVCLDNFGTNDNIRELPCRHEFHLECIDPWLKSKGTCPLCKYHIFRGHAKPSNRSVVTTTLNRSLSLDDIERQQSSHNDNQTNMDQVDTVSGASSGGRRPLAIQGGTLELAILASVV